MHMDPDLYQSRQRGGVATHTHSESKTGDLQVCLGGCALRSLGSAAEAAPVAQPPDSTSTCRLFSFSCFPGGGETCDQTSVTTTHLRRPLHGLSTGTPPGTFHIPWRRFHTAVAHKRSVASLCLWAKNNPHEYYLGQWRSQRRGSKDEPRSILTAAGLEVM